MTRRPSGTPPPERAATPDGELDLVALAEQVCRWYDAEFPDERDRYGDAGMEWCRHDNQHLIAWAAGDAHTGVVDLLEQVAWLARVLAARDFPLDRLARDLDLAAQVVLAETGDAAVSDRLGDAARFVREGGAGGGAAPGSG